MLTRDGEARREPIVRLVAEVAEPIFDLEQAELGSLLERIGDARVVLLGEASHGTSEFYRTRARITRLLVEQRGFDAVCIEGDWPDAALVDRWVRGRGRDSGEERPFDRFPTWMWRNREVTDLLAWITEHNDGLPRESQVGFYGLDLYSLYASIQQVLGYLDDKDPDAAARARARYGCLVPWEAEAQDYGYAVAMGQADPCQSEVVTELRDLLAHRLEYARRNGEGFVDAVMNARLVADAEAYYRAMYLGSVASWNLRDTHMVDTLEHVLAFRGPSSKAVVWAHNSHVGDARATQMGSSGEVNIGSLCRERFGDAVFNVGFGTDHGTVAAAHEWGGGVEVMTVRPSRADSYEGLFHEASQLGDGMPAFLVHLREPPREEVRRELSATRLERAIGVVYRPETERLSHYFDARLAEQFDAWLWFDETRAVTPLEAKERLVRWRPGEEPPETFPTGW